MSDWKIKLKLYFKKFWSMAIMTLILVVVAVEELIRTGALDWRLIVIIGLLVYTYWIRYHKKK